MNFEGNCVCHDLGLVLSAVVAPLNTAISGLENQRDKNQISHNSHKCEPKLSCHADPDTSKVRTTSYTDKHANFYCSYKSK